MDKELVIQKLPHRQTGTLGSCVREGTAGRGRPSNRWWYRSGIGHSTNLA